MSEKKDLIPRLQLEAFEIESLNLERLDVEELERRLEMAAGVAVDYGWWCDCNDHDPCTLCTCHDFTCNDNTCSDLCSYDCTDCLGDDIIIPI